jgi:pSer/pThr/pTyr-binding forkhead associated (FHA) protein
MTLNLIVASGAHEGEVIPILKFPFVVGRTQECHLHAASEFVSRRHCEISLHDNKPFVVDLDSTNGTFVNGQAVSHDQELSSGDRLHVGPLEFVVQLDSDASAGDVQPAPERKAGQVNEETAAALLLGEEGNDQEGGAEDTTEQASVAPHRSQI